MLVFGRGLKELPCFEEELQERISLTRLKDRGIKGACMRSSIS